MRAYRIYRPVTLLIEAFGRLREQLARNAELRLERSPEPSADGGRPGAQWRLTGQGMMATILVEARTKLQPSDVDYVFGRPSPMLQAQLRPVTLLVVASWLSPRTRHVLEDQGYSYST